MFTHDMAEAKQKEITMQGIEARYIFHYNFTKTLVLIYFYSSALEALINFSYSGKIKIDSDNVQNLLVGSSYLQLSKVREACADFLKHKYENI